MKKIILTISIFIIFFIPIFFSVGEDNIKTEIFIAKALTNKEKSVIERNKETKKFEDNFQNKSKKKFTTDEDGIIREYCVVDIICGVTNALNALMEKLAWVPIALSSMFVYITGILLNLSILETVVNFGNNFNNIAGITEAWSSLRDLANIFFIFGLLTIAISTILGLSSYGHKKLLTTLVLVALFVNFSLFFTKFVIDTSNIFAMQFYQSLASVGGDGTTGISNTFMHLLGVDKLWDTGGVLKTLNNINYNSTGEMGLMFLYSIFTFLFLIITAFVFAFAAIMLIIRAVAFILLTILSPLAFAAFVLPVTKKFASIWWEKLFQYAIFAPILLMLFWITATVAVGVSNTFAGNSNAGLLGAIAESSNERISGVGAIFNFIILITLMLASIIISNKLSLAGSVGISNFGKKMAKGATGKAVGGVMSIPGMFGRNLIGRGFSKLSQSEKLKDKASKEGLGGFAARQGLKFTRAGAKANYDLKSAPGVSSVAKGLGVDMGGPQKGGYEAILKKQTKDREEFSKSLEPNKVVQAKKKQPLEEGRKEIEKERKTAEGSKSSASTEVENINKRIKALISEGKKDSPEMETLEINLTAAEANLAEAKKRVEDITKNEDEIKEKLKGIDNIGKERALDYANQLVENKVRVFGVNIPILVSRKNKEAAVAIQSRKSKEKLLLNNIKDKIRKEMEGEKKDS